MVIISYIIMNTYILNVSLKAIMKTSAKLRKKDP